MDICRRDILPGGVNIVKAHENLPVSVNYRERQTLGTDRLCNALACAAMFAGSSCIIIDAGTAITVDYLRGGTVFEGGAIMPGCAMQAEALHRRTSSLPSVRLGDIEDGVVALPSASTEECIRAGILFGTAGAVERCANEYLRLDAGAKIIATGGGWGMIEPLVNSHKVETVPDLTLIGAAIYC
jgi:type III pantothenate kinase